MRRDCEATRLAEKVEPEKTAAVEATTLPRTTTLEADTVLEERGMQRRMMVTRRARRAPGRCTAPAEPFSRTR